MITSSFLYGSLTSFLYGSFYSLRFPCGSANKESACNAGDLGSIPGLGRYPGQGKGYPQSFWPGEFHGLSSSWDRKELDTTEQLSLFSLYSCHVFLISSASVRSIPFVSFIVPIFAWNVPLVSLIFFKWSLVFPILLFSSISLQFLLRKAFSSLPAVLWNSPFRWVYLSLSPLPFTSFLSYL